MFIYENNSIKMTKPSDDGCIFRDVTKSPKCQAHNGGVTHATLFSHCIQIVTGEIDCV